MSKTGAAFLEKCPTGIKGFDEISDGGLPKGRTSLVCGSAGCGKTVLAMEFLLRGAIQYKKPQLPPPVKKLIGDLANTERVLVGLELKPAVEVVNKP